MLLLAANSVLAHHGRSTKFDPDQPRTITGNVLRVDWANPHIHIFMSVEINGKTQTWYVEQESPQLLELNGWTADSLQQGALITVQGIVARDGSRQLWADSVALTNSGQPLFTLEFPNLLSSIKQVTPEAAPRWPDGKVRLGAAPGRAGYWIPDTTVLMEEGVEIAMEANGLLADITDASRVAPLQEWALRLYETRQANFLRSDPTYLECRPPAGPRKFLNSFGIQLLEDKALERIFVIAGGGNHDWHLVYTDGRALDSAVYDEDAGNLLFYGRNTAHWEDDTLVIESEGYNEKFWLPGGLPHSELMHVTEKLTRVDYNTMQYQLTINDPGTYTRVWQAAWKMRWLEGQDPPEHYCQDNRL